MVTVSYGVGNQTERPASSYASIDGLVRDLGVQAVLGYEADSVEVRVNGATVDTQRPLRDGMHIQLIRRAGHKSK